MSLARTRQTGHWSIRSWDEKCPFRDADRSISATKLKRAQRRFPRGDNNQPLRGVNGGISRGSCISSVQAVDRFFATAGFDFMLVASVVSRIVNRIGRRFVPIFKALEPSEPSRAPFSYPAQSTTLDARFGRENNQPRGVGVMEDRSCLQLFSVSHREDAKAAKGVRNE